jgi:hypothetical protein
MTARLPGGDTDPCDTFASVGHALTAWEQMEAQLATTYSIFIGRPRQIDAMSNYGLTFRIFRERANAVLQASEKYFISCPDQCAEGDLRILISRATDLSIERHRIAHGILQAVPEYDARLKDQDGWVMPVVRYRLGAPWYAAEKLKSPIVGKESTEINLIAQKFSTLRDDVARYNVALSPEQ